MWLTLGVAVVCALFLWREAQEIRRGMRSRRQMTLRAIGCALLLSLAMVLQFKEAILPSGEVGSGVRLLRLLQFLVGVFVLVVALVLVALLDARETLQRYVQERRQMINSLIQTPSEASAPSSEGERDEGSL